MSRKEKCDEEGCEIQKEIVHILVDFTLPPPIYGYELTTKADRAERTIKLVKSITHTEGAVIVTSIEGNKYIVPIGRVQYYQEE